MVIRRRLPCTCSKGMSSRKPPPPMGAYAAVLPGTARVGGRTVQFDAGDGDAFYRTFLALTRLAATPVVG